MSLLKMHFLPLVGLLFLVSTAFQGIYGLNCYSCSSLEDCAKQMQMVTCKESEINCATKFDKTKAIISTSCAETCDADACCSSELCNTFVALDATEATTASDATATQTTTKSSDETSNDGSSDTTSSTDKGSSDTTSSTDKGSSDTTKSDSESTPTTVPTPATTTESHSNSGTTFTKTLFVIALGIFLSLLTIF